MRAPFSYVVAATIVAGTAAAWSVAPAAAAQFPTATMAQSGIQMVEYRGDRQHGDWNNGNRRDDEWRNRRHHHHDRRRNDNFFPGFSFSFGVPFAYTPYYYAPAQQDCFRDRYGRLYCTAY